MEQTEAVAAPASAEETAPSTTITPPSPSPPSSSSSAPPPEKNNDPLAKALQILFLNVTTLVQGELQVGLLQYFLPSFASLWHRPRLYS